MQRRLVADGPAFGIECAVRKDLSSPVAEFLDDLANGVWAVRRDKTLDSLDSQVSLLDTFLAGMAHLAEYGDLPHGIFHNVLREGIWEFKKGSIRITYYDTDGEGGHVPKYAVRGFVTRQVDWPEDYDQFLRLTTAFEKTTQTTPPGEIQKAKNVREEDLRHDQ